MRSAISILAILFVAMLAQSPSAYATSPYDEVVSTIDTLRISDGSGGSADISHNWRSLLAECKPSASESLESVIENGGYWLVINEGGEVGDAYIRWTSEESAYTSFFMDKFENPSWGTSPGTFSVARINWYKSDGKIGCEYYPTVENSKSTALIPLPYSSELPLYFSNYPVSYPEEYEGVTIPSQPPAAKYVAMGDSFSSGEGNSPFEVGTDVSEGSGENKCHRSPEAYPRLLDEDSELELGLMHFVACSGATTANVLHGGSSNGSWTDPPQVDALSEDTEVVTITIGGNDIGFGEFAEECVFGTCDSESEAFINSQEELEILPIKITGFESEPNGVLDVIHKKAPSAHVYVIGYPQIVPSVMPEGCPSINTEAEYETIRNIVTELNEVVKNATQSAAFRYGFEYFTYVDPTAEESPFIGREYCTLFPFFNEPDPIHPKYSFHPNGGGQQAYKEIVGSYISE